jgi:hypothetical protein
MMISCAKEKERMEKAVLKIKIWTDGESSLPEDLAEAFAPHVEHVLALVQQGYLAGDICDNKFRGWWSIDGE